MHTVALEGSMLTICRPLVAERPKPRQTVRALTGSLFGQRYFDVSATRRCASNRIGSVVANQRNCQLWAPNFCA